MTNLTEEVTTAVLGVLKRGGDNYNIYIAVKAALAATPAVGGEAITKALNAFSDFINEPPQYEDKRMVRDYRHELARKWVPVFEAIQAAMATPAAPTAPPASPLRGRESEIEIVGWAILQALHVGVEDGPQSWSDMASDQEKRIKKAAIAAIEAVTDLSQVRRITPGTARRSADALD